MNEKTTIGLAFGSVAVGLAIIIATIALLPQPGIEATNTMANDLVVQPTHSSVTDLQPTYNPQKTEDGKKLQGSDNTVQSTALANYLQGGN